MSSHFPETTGGISAGMADRTGREITLRMTGTAAMGKVYRVERPSHMTSHTIRQQKSVTLLTSLGPREA